MPGGGGFDSEWYVGEKESYSQAVEKMITI